MAGLQTIISTAQSIEINRSRLVGQTISRSGRILTASRNWANPFRFVVVPRPIWRFTEVRSVLEDLMTADRNISHSIQLGVDSQGAVNGSRWLIGYQGSAPGGTTGYGGTLSNITITSMAGTTITMANCPTAGTIFAKGDYIQPTNYRYPFVVTQDLIGNGTTTRSVTVHRSFLPQTGFTLAGSTVKVGTSCVFNVIVSGLPTYRYISGEFIEFNGNFELVEEIL